MPNEQDRQPTNWGTSRPGPLESDDLVEGAVGTEGRPDREGGIREDDMLNAARGTADEDIAAQTLGMEENDDMDVGVAEWSDIEPVNTDMLSDNALVSEGGALDHDETRNVTERGDTGAGGTMDDDETMGPNQRQPDGMALNRSTITRQDLEPRKGSARDDVGNTYNTQHARTTAASESERLPGEDTLDSFREHEPVIGSFTGADEGATQAAGASDVSPARETDDEAKEHGSRLKPGNTTAGNLREREMAGGGMLGGDQFAEFNQENDDDSE